MTTNGVLQIAVYFAIILALTKPLGIFMARLFDGERTFLHPVLRPLEVWTYKLVGIDERTEQRWTQYAASLLAFSIFSFCLFICCSGCKVFCRLIRKDSAQTQVSPICVQYCRQFRNQHKLAVLQRRIYSQLFRADGRSDGSKFRFGGGGNRGRDRACARFCTAEDRTA